MKKFYDMNANGEPYDANERRKGCEVILLGNAKMGGSNVPTKVKVSAPSAAPKASASKTIESKVGGAKSSGKVLELENELAEMKLNNDTLEKERDFYFGKLRDIEVLLQSLPQENPLSEQILKILYATEDDKVEIDESGNVNIISAENGAEVQQEEEVAADSA
jgi:RP/EB family microtubule-associated protein